MQEFVNTMDLRRDRELLTSCRSLGRWLEAHDLLGHSSNIDDDDLALALEVREALRALFDPHSRSGADVADALNEVVRRGGIVPYVNPSGVVRLKPTAGGVAGGLGRIVAISLLALLDGSGGLLRTCGATECRSLFFAGSRSRSADRCQDPLCGGGRHRLRVRRLRGTPT